MKKTALVIIAALAAFSAGAQDRAWTLGDCIRYAIDHNISLKQSRLNVEQKELDLSTAKGKRLPGLAASASENLSFGRGLGADNTYTNSNTTSTSLNLGADIPIFQGFSISDGIKISSLDLSSATQKLRKAENDLSVNVAKAYIQILYDEEVLKVALSQEACDKELLESVRARMESGKASLAEVASQEAVLAQSSLSVAQARGNLSISRLDLSQLLELSTPDSLNIVFPQASALAPALLSDPEQIWLQALDTRPEILDAALSVERSKIAVHQAKGAFLPSLSFSGGIGTNFYTVNNQAATSFGNQLKNNFSQYLGLSLNIPIFSRLANRNNLKGARLNLRNETLNEENSKKTLYKEIQQAYYNALSSQVKYESSLKTAESERRRFELTSEKYKAGLAGITEYNDARNSRFKAESEMLRARYESVFQAKLLDFYAGTALDL